MPGREGDGWKLHHTIMEYVIRYDLAILNLKRFWKPDSTLQVPSMVLLLLLSLAALASTAKVPLFDIYHCDILETVLEI